MAATMRLSMVTQIRSTSITIFLITRPPPRPTLFPYTTLFRSDVSAVDVQRVVGLRRDHVLPVGGAAVRSEEHTSELQSRFDLVCRLLLEKKNRVSFFFCIGDLIVQTL